MTDNTPDSVAGDLNRHEAVCAFRWQSVEKQLATMHDRLNSMSNRMWAAAGALIGLLVVGMAGLLIIVINKGHP